MPESLVLSLPANAALFVLAAGVIGVAGWYLTDVAGRLADRTGLGQAVIGAVFLGATTSLSGTVTSVTAALGNHPDLALGNAIGGIAAQTAFLAIADMTYTRANLEHAAASAANIMQGALLVSMLALILAAMVAPEVTLLGVHPVSAALVATYVFGMGLVSRAHARPMWRPRRTAETREDLPRKAQGGSLRSLIARFLALASLVAVAGWVIAQSAVALAAQSGLSETALGAVFTAVSTSLPELVTALAAVRQGALTLAVGDIIGGNTYDTLFVAMSDAAYREGSILHAVSPEHFILLIAVCLLQTGFLLMGMVHREKHGIANIGFESFLILLLYVGAVVMLLRS